MSAVRQRLVVVAAVAAMIGATCGSDDPTPLVAENSNDTSTSIPTTLPPPADDGDGPGEPVVDDDEGYEPTRAMPDITDRREHSIDDVVVSEDGEVLGVRYEAASEPCSGAVAEAIESADNVTVTLETGLNPDAATMTCIAQVIRYELAVSLEEPLGDRALIFETEESAPESDPSGATGSSGEESQAPAPTRSADNDGDEDADHPTTTTRPSSTTETTETADEPPSGLSPPGAFVGLSLGEATSRADAEGRAWRIGRQDDEQFALTADYDPDRVTFEVDDGVVTNAVAG